MEVDSQNRIVYSINIRDIQDVSQQILKRNLTKDEIKLVEESIGDYLDWFQAIEYSIHKHITI